MPPRQNATERKTNCRLILVVIIDIVMGIILDTN